MNKQIEYQDRDKCNDCGEKILIKKYSYEIALTIHQWKDCVVVKRARKENWLRNQEWKEIVK